MPILRYLNTGGSIKSFSLASVLRCCFQGVGMSFHIAKYTVNIKGLPVLLSIFALERGSLSSSYRSVKNRKLFSNRILLNGIGIAGLPHKGSNWILVTKVGLAIEYHFL